MRFGFQVGRDYTQAISTQLEADEFATLGEVNLPERVSPWANTITCCTQYIA